MEPGSSKFDVIIHELSADRWIVEAIELVPSEGLIRQTRFSGTDARDRAHKYAADKYGPAIAQQQPI